MGGTLSLSAESVEWMERLGANPGWTVVGDAWPSECFRALIWLGLVERDGDEPRFRLTDAGAWAMINEMIEVA